MLVRRLIDRHRLRAVPARAGVVPVGQRAVAQIVEGPRCDGLGVAGGRQGMGSVEVLTGNGIVAVLKGHHTAQQPNARLGLSIAGLLDITQRLIQIVQRLAEPALEAHQISLPQRHLSLLPRIGQRGRQLPGLVQVLALCFPLADAVEDRLAGQQ